VATPRLRRLTCAIFTLAFFATAAPANAAPAAMGSAPIAAGTSAANIALNGAARRVMVRWVARRTALLSALHLRIEAGGADCRLDTRSGYGAGNGGSWHAVTYPVTASGLPDTSRPLTTQDFRPCSASTAVADVRQGVVRLAMNLPVLQGQELATVISNTDPSAGTNWTSTNFLYTSTGLVGANARNERDASATDSYYGLDPREVVGFSSNSGGSWTIPATPGDPGYLPTYIQEYSEGDFEGQPYYYTQAVAAQTTMVYKGSSVPSTIRGLGAFASGTATGGLLVLAVDGVVRGEATVSGSGMLRAAISPVAVRPDQTVTVTATNIPIRNVVADEAWADLMGMQNLSSRHWWVQGNSNYSVAAPVYPLSGGASTSPLPPTHSGTSTQPVCSAGIMRKRASRKRRPTAHHKRSRRRRPHSRRSARPTRPGRPAPPASSSPAKPAPPAVRTTCRKAVRPRKKAACPKAGPGSRAAARMRARCLRATRPRTARRR